MIFFLFFSENRIDISYKLSPLETICRKCQNMISENNKKNISVCHLLKILPGVLSIKSQFLCVFKFEVFIVEWDHIL